MKIFPHIRFFACVAQVGWLAANVALAQTSSTRQATLPGPGIPAPAESVTAQNPVPMVHAAPVTEIAVTGQVLRTKQVDLRGTMEKNLVALLDIGNGQRQIVELGPAANYKLAPVYSGDQIAARGPRARIGQMDVLLANQATIGSREIMIRRDTPTATVAAVVKAGYPVAEQVGKIEGRVNRLRTARLEGSQQEHVLAEIVARGGQAIVTDLGPPEQNWRADVKAGEWITLRGQEMKIENRPVFLALEINKSGVPVLIDRHLVRGQPAEVVQPGPIAETAAVVRPPAVVTPPTTLVPGTTVEQTTRAAVVPARVSPPVVPVVP